MSRRLLTSKLWCSARACVRVCWHQQQPSPVSYLTHAVHFRSCFRSWSIALSASSHAQRQVGSAAVTLEILQDGAGRSPTVITHAPMRFAKGTSATVAEAAWAAIF